MLILALLAAAFFLAYANGANDNFKAVATVFGAGTLPYRKALWLATAAQLAGSLMSPFLAAVLITAFSGKGLVPEYLVADPRFVLSVAFAAALVVIVCTRAGLPVSTTHALIGGLTGAGLAFAPGGVAWVSLGTNFFVPLISAPVMALVAAAAIYPVARQGRKWLGVEANSCVCLETVTSSGDAFNGTAVVAQSDQVAVRAGTATSCDYSGMIVGLSAQRVADTIHMGSACALGFARGLNDTAKVLGVVWIAKSMGVRLELLLPATAAVMALGGLLHSRRLAETMGHNITAMNTGQGLVANGVASTLVIGASLMGSPVSTTHVSTGSIFGIGIWTGSTNWRLIGGIVLAWIATLPLGAAFAYVLGQGFRLF